MAPLGIRALRAQSIPGATHRDHDRVPGGGEDVPYQCRRQEMWVQFLSWEDPWRRARQPTPVFLPGESNGQRILAGYSPWGHKESVTEVT